MKPQSPPESIRDFVIRTHRYLTMTEMEATLGCRKADIYRVVAQENLTPIKAGERTINYILQHPHMSWSIFLSKLHITPINLRTYYNTLCIPVPKKTEHGIPFIQYVGRVKYKELMREHLQVDIDEAEHTIKTTTQAMTAKAKAFHEIADKYGAPNVFENMVSPKTPCWSF